MPSQSLLLNPRRGVPMAAFGAVAIGSTGLGPVIMAWVEANPKLEWRWIQWIQYIVRALISRWSGAQFRSWACTCRSSTLSCARRAQRSFYAGRRIITGTRSPDSQHVSHREARWRRSRSAWLFNSPSCDPSVSHHSRGLSRADTVAFLFVEPVVTFFSLWVGLCVSSPLSLAEVHADTQWGVFYIQIAGLPYVYQNIFGFSITGVGLVYLAMM